MVWALVILGGLVLAVGGLAVSLYRQFGLLEVELVNQAQALRNLASEQHCLSGRLARMEIRRDDWEGDFGPYRSTRPVELRMPQRFTVSDEES